MKKAKLTFEILITAILVIVFFILILLALKQILK